MNLAVIESMRHKGIARALVMQALEAGLAQAARCAVLELRASNNAAHALYRSLGFRDVTIRPTYYTNPIEDALLMELDPIVSESGRLREEVGREVISRSSNLIARRCDMLTDSMIATIAEQLRQSSHDFVYWKRRITVWIWNWSNCRNAMY